jgi:hydroxylysine kinase
VSTQQSALNGLTERFAATPPAEAAALLLELYGIVGEVTRLSSEADETFAVETPDRHRLILKIANPSEREENLNFQGGVLLHLEKIAPDLRVPRLIRTQAGDFCPKVGLADGSVRFIRAMSWLEGRQLWEVASTPALMFALGSALGALDAALASHQADVPEIDLIWNLSRAAPARQLLEHVADPRKRVLAEAAFVDLAEIVEPLATSLPRQIIHNDINPYNVLVAGPKDNAIGGIIDFGDMVFAPRINDLAIALSYHVGKPDGRALVRAAVVGFTRVLALDELEKQILGTLVRGRLAMTIAITEWRSSLRPDHAEYIKRNQPASVAGLERLANFDRAALRDFFFGDE